MKRVILAALVAGLVLLTQGLAFAQTPDYELYVANQMVVGTDLFFDIFLARTGETHLYLANAEFVLTFNSANFSSPTVVVVTSDARLLDEYLVDPSIVSGNRCVVNVAPPAVANPTQLANKALDVATTGSLIATVKLSGVSNPDGSAGLAWRNITPNSTLVTYIDPATYNQLNATDPSNHISPDDQPLPVTLTAFNAKVNTTSGGVLLEWKTASEVNNYGYTVQRKGADETAFTDLSGAFIPGKGTTLDPQSYSYVDRSIDAVGSYTYRLKQQDMDGTIHYSGTIVVQMTLTDVAEMAPREFKLMQNYPNPFNPSTQVKFSVENAGRAVLKVYNVLGEEVATLFDGTAEAGRYYVSTFDATGLASGIYIYRLTTEQKNDVHKMLLLR